MRARIRSAARWSPTAMALSRAACVVLSLVSPACAGGDGAPRFSFNPPDGTKFVETVVTTMVTEVSGLGSVTRYTELGTEVAILHIADGYEVTATVLSAETRSDQPEARAPALEALEGAVITYQVDSEGQLTSIGGVAEAAARFREALSPEPGSGLEGYLTEEKLRESAEIDWRNSFGHITGHPAQIGSAWVSTEEMPLPNDEVAVAQVGMKVVAQDRIAGHNCLRIEFRYAADPDELRTFLGDGYLAPANAEPIGKRRPKITGEGYSMVDPVTGLCYGKRTRRTLETTIAIPDRGDFPATMRFTKTYRYEYRSAQ